MEWVKTLRLFPYGFFYVKMTNVICLHLNLSISEQTETFILERKCWTFDLLVFFFDNEWALNGNY